MNRIKSVILLLLVSLTITGQEMSVAERNAAQGFNDTIDRMAEDFVEAYIVIADPGGSLYSVLGHCALRLKCDAFNLDYVFSYESEDVAQKTLAFLAGHLKMGLFAIPIDDYCSIYAKEGRGVRQYKLNLSPTVKQDLWRKLDDEVAHGNQLDYDYYHRGCAISCVRFLNKALNGKKIQYAPWERKQVSGRELVREHTTNSLWVRFVTCFISGNEVDEPLCGENQLIIPVDLVKAWQRATLDNTLLLSQETEVIVEGEPQVGNSWFTPHVFSFLILLLCIGNLFWNKSYWDWLMLTAVTIVGIMQTYLLFVSDLCCTDWNWLYIIFNPLPAILWYWRKYWVWPYVGVQVIWCVTMIYMLITNQVLVDWPHIVLALAFSLVLLKQSPRFMQWIKK